MHSRQLMTPGTRHVSQTIIEVEAKLLDDSTSGERRQARLPIVGRNPGLRGVLSPGVELVVLDGNAVDSELEVVDGAHDGGVEAARFIGQGQAVLCLACSTPGLATRGASV